METTNQQGEKVSAEVESEGTGAASVRLRGRLDVRSTGECWRYLEAQLSQLRPESVRVDASELDFSGSIGIVLLRYLTEGGMSPGARVTVEGLSRKTEEILERLPAEDFRSYRPAVPVSTWVVEEVGCGTRALLRDLREEVEFVGSLAVALPAAVIRPRRMRWREVRRLVETAGANALPVVLLFSGLVGLVLALESAKPLAQLGAQIFVADMIGFSSLRSVGPLVTAIMLVGRSGSAFAAELGTMKVNQELDALTTMGLEPVRFLVLQRVVAAAILTPILSLWATAAAMLGGVLVMRFQGFPPRMIFQEIGSRVGVNDLAIGLSKAVVFGIIVGGIGCLRGLQTGKGPQAVGVSTTRSVVAGILLVILANTVFSVVDYVIK